MNSTPDTTPDTSSDDATLAAAPGERWDSWEEDVVAIARRLQGDLSETRIERDAWKYAAEVHERSLQSVAAGTIIGDLQAEVRELRATIARVVRLHDNRVGSSAKGSVYLSDLRAAIEGKPLPELGSASAPIADATTGDKTC